MDRIVEFLPFIATMTAVGGAMLAWIVRHAKAHQQIKDRLDAGESAFARNSEDHARILRKQDATDAKLDDVHRGICELLVHEDLRKPGEAINGK